MIETITNWLATNFKFSVDPDSNEILLNGAAVADIASIASLIIVVVGFFVTLRTLRESIRLNKLQTLPLIHFKYETARGGKLSIVNNGKSPAVGIKIEKLFNVTNEPNMQMVGLTVTSFKHKNFLAPEEECAVKLESRGPWAAWGEEMSLYSMFREEKPVKYYVWYKDLSNRRYVMRISVHNEDADITGIPMIYGLRMRLVVLLYLAKDYCVVGYRLIRYVYIPNTLSWIKQKVKK
ncbi:MAG: hypothetical protein WAR37_04410 [Candidatus Microsaccharimonas sp.]